MLPRFGVVFFDDPESPIESPAWASEAGAPPFRIDSIGALKSDVVWITNLEFAQMSINRLYANPKLRRVSFFRDSLYKMAQELGFTPSPDNPGYIQVLSEIVDRTMRVADDHYHFEGAIGNSFRETVNECLFTPMMDMDASGTGNIRLDEYMKEALLFYQRCYGNTNTEKNHSVSFKFSRGFYAKLIMSMPVPDGVWTPLKEFPRTNKNGRGVTGEVYKFLSEDEGSRRPMLCRVSVSNMDPSVADLLDVANGTERRNWIPSMEAALLSLYADVEIKEVYQAEGYKTISEDFKIGIPKQGWAGAISFSFGIIAENHWLALATERKVSQYGREVKITPARAVWMRSWDRLMCFKAAALMKQAGFPVRGYGIGTVDVSVLSERIPTAIRTAKGIGLGSPLWLVNLKNAQEQYASGGIREQNRTSPGKVASE